MIKVAYILLLLTVISLVGVPVGNAATGENLNYEEMGWLIQDIKGEWPEGSVIPNVPTTEGHINNLQYDRALYIAYPGVIQAPGYLGYFDLCKFCHIPLTEDINGSVLP
jgi:hypothetical protein